ncbi:MAG: hypothetical protein JW881_21205 [Spirochaetales bacterium]|nr:hypothetical protein [Spirochaetales bacterium]
MRQTAVVLISFFIGVVILSCSATYKSVYSEDWSELETLPEDTGGEHLAFLGKEYPRARNGFYIYLPAGYKTSAVKYPTLLFLHGADEAGNSNWDREILANVCKNGPPRMIEEGEWDPPVPFIVISPQSMSVYHLWYGFEETFNALAEEYPIDKTRAYMTGLSMGGSFIWEVMRNEGGSLQCAAVVPVCGTAMYYDRKPKDYIRNVRNYPVWAFHGKYDTVVDPNPAYRAVAGINETDPPFPVKFTLFSGLDHTCWEEVYTSKLETPTDPDFDPFDEDIYSWLLHYRRIEK